MDKKIPTIKEIAIQLNVSVSTVSRALHNHPSIGLQTRLRVQALAKELNYEPNQTAIFFKQGKTSTIGVILPRFSEEFFSLAINGIEDMASMNKYNVLIGQSQDNMEKEKRIVEMMKNNRVDGLLVSVSKNTSSYEHFENLRNYNIPVVFFDCVPDLPGLNSVSCNLGTGTLQAVTYLVKKGHTRIGLLNGPSQLQATGQRREFFEQGLKKNLLKIHPSLIVETDLSAAGNHMALRQLLSQAKPPTAVVAFNDYVALDAMQYLRTQKSPKSKNIGFVSFAHLPLCRYLESPPLASVEQFPYEQGYKAMEMLYNLLNSREEAPPNTQIVLESELRANA